MQSTKTTYLLIAILLVLLVAMLAVGTFAFFTFGSVDVNINDNMTVSAIQSTNTAVQGYINMTATARNSTKSAD